MAIINCSECNNQVSDKAKACPSCGYPLAVMAIEPKEPELSNYSQYDSSELLKYAYKYQSEGSNTELDKAINIFKYIITNHSASFDAIYAKNEMDKIEPDYKPEIPLNDRSELVAKYNPETGITVWGYDDDSTLISGNNDKYRHNPKIENGNDSKDTAWSIGTTVLYAFVSFAFPIFGFFIGIYGVCHKPKRGQGVLLIVISLIAWACYGILLAIVKAILGSR